MTSKARYNAGVGGPDIHILRIDCVLSPHAHARPLMKHTLSTNKDGNLFTIVTEGDANVDGIIEFLKEILAHPQWRPGNLILVDHRSLKVDSINKDGIEVISWYFKSIARQLGNGRIALVMNRDIDFGIARAWEIVTASEVGIKINVFKNIDDAMYWLEA